ncbi:MAG TPA: phosphoribosylaminoimidazolesuccinocarboxamide synthase [Candidatus Omnitrophica bacterium]|nr:phosphoribosylaminoimidazolesuccinocarboxamide synthase [Candidatus Omnitrophota bacterium]
MKANSVREIDIPNLSIFRRGKVRDVYELDGSLLFVASDRISCFDVVLPDAIPYKGVVLNRLSHFWFGLTKDIIGNHCLGLNISEYPGLESYADLLKGRSMIVKRAEPVPFEYIVRGYLAGSGWKDYRNTREVSGIKLAEGMKEAQKFQEPIFTPSTKEDSGHDVAVSFDFMKDKIGSRLASEIRAKSIELYNFAEKYAGERGIIIADTKFEFGLLGGELMLIDELFTPDSSRFWPKESYREGRSQESYDKQYVRDWLENSGWDKTPPAPNLPGDIIERTSKKYLAAYKSITGEDLF